jgi:methyl coenzyme M reductase beta subunit
MLKYDTGPPPRDFWGVWFEAQMRANADYWGAYTQQFSAFGCGVAQFLTAPAQIGEAFARSLRHSAIASRVKVTRRGNVSTIEWLAQTGPAPLLGNAQIIAFPGHFREHH